jgi:hypothetical protein
VVWVDEEPRLVGEAESTHSSVTHPPGHCWAESLVHCVLGWLIRNFPGHGVMDYDNPQYLG